MSGKNDGQNEGLGLLIFLAILLHKAPAAIGFGTFLQHEGISQSTLLKHLVVRRSHYDTLGFHPVSSFRHRRGLLCAHSD